MARADVVLGERSRHVLPALVANRAVVRREEELREALDQDRRRIWVRVLRIEILKRRLVQRRLLSKRSATCSCERKPVEPHLLSDSQEADPVGQGNSTGRSARDLAEEAVDVVSPPKQLDELLEACEVEMVVQAGRRLRPESSSVPIQANMRQMVYLKRSPYLVLAHAHAEPLAERVNLVRLDDLALLGALLLPLKLGTTILPDDAFPNRPSLGNFAQDTPPQLERVGRERDEVDEFVARTGGRGAEQ